MCKKLVFLISFVLVLSLSSNALAEDRSPPVWAGGPQTGYVVWEFTEDTDYPTSGRCEPPYYYDPELTDPKFGNRYNGVGGMEFTYRAGVGLYGDGSVSLADEEESIVMAVPTGTGANITIYCQITWKGTWSTTMIEGQEAGLGHGLEIWEGAEDWVGGPGFEEEFPGGYMDGDNYPTPIEETVLGGGWTHSVFQATFPSAEITYVHIILGMDIGNEIFFDQIVVDMIIHDGEDPPTTGPQERPSCVIGGGPTKGRPQGGRIDPNELLLIWNPDPCSAQEIVYFSSNRVDVNTRQQDANRGIQDANWYPTGGNYLGEIYDLNAGGTYYWLIKEVNVPIAFDACGPLWQFTLKDANAADPSPEVNDFAGPCPTLKWDPGAYAVEHRVYFDVNEVNVINRVAPCTITTDPCYTPGTLVYNTKYYWAVDENDVCDVLHLGPVWYFRVPRDPCDGAVWRYKDDTFYTIWAFQDDWGSGTPSAADFNSYPVGFYPPNEPNCVDPPNDWEADYTPLDGSAKYGIADNNNPPEATAGSYGYDTIRFKHTDNATPGQNVEVRVGIIWSGVSRPSVTVGRYTNWENGPTLGTTGSDEGAWMETWEALGNNKNEDGADLEFEIELCDGWKYSVYEVFFETITQEADNIHVFISSGGAMYLDRVDVDAHWYTSPFAAGPSPEDEEEDVSFTDTCLKWYPGAYVDKHEIYFGEKVSPLGAPETHTASNPAELSEKTFNLDWVYSGVWLPDFNNATGVWHLIGDAEMEFRLANYDNDDPNKIIDIFITWQSANTRPEGAFWAWEEDSVKWGDANQVGNDVDLGSGWKESYYQFVLEPNPEGEVITLTCEAPNDIYIADVCIMTDCNGRTTDSFWHFDACGFGEGPPYVATIDANSYCPELKPGIIYYWMVDEVNDACSPYRWRNADGAWSFTTIPYAIIDDFNDYDTRAGVNPIRHFLAGGPWKDGWSLPPPDQSGQVFLIGAPAYNTVPYHSAPKAMHNRYFDVAGWGNGLLERTFVGDPCDWTQGGLTTLVLYFYGDATSGGADPCLATDLWVTLGDDDDNDGDVDDSHTVYYVADFYGDAGDLIAKEWIEWNIALQDFNEFGNVNPDKIRSIGLGVKDGSEGNVYYDDIRLYVRRCVPMYAFDITSDSEGVFGGEPDCIVDHYDLDAMFGDWLVKDSNCLSIKVNDDDPNLLAWYKLDLNADDSSGRGKHATIAMNAAGTAALNPVWSADVNEESDGNSINLDGFNYIDIPDLCDVNVTQASICLWVKVDKFVSTSLELHQLQAGDDYPTGTIHIAFVGGEDTIDAIEFSGADFGEAAAELIGVDFGEWVHVAWTYDSNGIMADPNAVGKHKGYINGELIDDTNSAADSNLVALGPAAVGAWNSEGKMRRFMDARFDDIRFYDRVLSQGEIVYLTGVTPGDDRWWPPPSLAEFVSDEPWGQKYINFRDYTFLMQYWLMDQWFPFEE